ncbi:hypothetical protein BH10BAC5_BH10BAC5_15180 [soil metagenome]
MKRSILLVPFIPTITPITLSFVHKFKVKDFNSIE